MVDAGTLELLERAQAGEQEAFDDLVAPHRESIRRFALAAARSSADADDIAQETMMRAMRSIGSFRADSSFTTWLYALTKNAGIDWYRKKQFREQPDDFSEEPTAHVGLPKPRTQDEVVEEQDEVDLLYRAIQELPATYRVPLILHEMEGISYEHIAEIEDIPVGTVRSRLNRARSHLAKLMGHVRDIESARIEEGESST